MSLMQKGRPRRHLTAWCAVALLACGGTEDDGAVQEPVPMPDPSPIEYPLALWDQRVEGETEVLIHVNEFGDVDSVQVARASGHAAFDSAAIRGARRLRFSPGRRGDRRVAMWLRVPVRFSQDSTASLGAATSSGIIP